MCAKILLSAFACSPVHGSEPAVGWHWATEIAKLGHDVWVLTNANQKNDIQRATDTLAAYPRLHFVYHALPKRMPAWLSRFSGNRADYTLWQWTAYRRAKNLHAAERFDIVHHITWGSIRQPSFMGHLGIPFVLGPLGGGDRAPWSLRKGYGLRGHAQDLLRDVSNTLIKIDPLVRNSFRAAHRIYTRTPASRDLIPLRWKSKVFCLTEIGVDASDLDGRRQNTMGSANRFRVLFVGRFVYLKGMHIGLPAFAKLRKTHPQATLTMAGSGPDEHRWRAQATAIGLDESVTWLSWVPHTKMAAIYQDSDVLLFPSLHDSGGTAILEAFTHGLPVVCLDLGGPGILVNDTCGRVVRTDGRVREQVIDDLADALITLASDRACCSRLGQGAIDRAGELTWSTHVRRAYSDLFGGTRHPCGVDALCSTATKR